MKTSRRSRRGSAYLLVLSTTTVIAALVSGTVYAQTQRLRSERASADASKARLAAESGIEVVRAWIKQDASWRANRLSGRWASNLALGEAKVDLDVVDTVDGVLANHPYDGVTITSTARVGDAEQIVTATLTAKPYPMDALAYAMHTAGQLHIGGSGDLRIGSATASTNGSLKNDATIEGNARAGSVATAGTVFGTLTSGASATALPPASVAETVAAIGKLLPSSDKYDSVSLSSTSNPYGSPNSRGVYVIRSTKDIEVKDMSVNGTLVIIAPGSKVTFTKGVNFSPSSGMPALIVDGDATFDDKVDGTIRGLLHVTGKLSLDGALTVRGLVLCGSSATADAVVVKDEQAIVYDSAQSDYAPMGYAKSVDMVCVPGSYQRVVR